MSDPIILISSTHITRQALREFVATRGGESVTDAALPEHLGREGAHLWIGLSTEELEATIADGGDDYARHLAQLLGGSAVSAVTVEMNRAAAAEQLALEFALALADRWPVVADGHGDDAQSRLSSPEALRRRLDALTTTP